MTNCHPECGPITARVDGRHAHENEDGRCWHDDDDVVILPNPSSYAYPPSPLDLVTLKEPDDVGMELFAVVEGDAFRIDPPAPPFYIADVYPWLNKDAVSALESERAAETYGSEWVVLWARDEEDALARAAQYDQGLYRLDALVNI